MIFFPNKKRKMPWTSDIERHILSFIPAHHVTSILIRQEIERRVRIHTPTHTYYPWCHRLCFISI